MVAWLLWASWVLNWLWVRWRGSCLLARPSFRRIDAAGTRFKSNRKPEWVVRQLVLLKAHLPEAGCRTLALTFNRVFAHRQMTVSKSFVHQTLRANAHAVWLARKAIRQAKPRPVAINHCWGIDLTGRADEGGSCRQSWAC